MATILVTLGILAVIASASIMLIACMASARVTETEAWAEEPLVMPEMAPQRSTTSRLTS